MSVSPAKDYRQVTLRMLSYCTIATMTLVCTLWCCRSPPWRTHDLRPMSRPLS
ncbi:pollen-specific leucine-rich repeat extensin-like protein 3 [Iris pallida]|uniref:Pollen-specific leucine-rich repeat extensin-like protein 3 n=1 Tax=Iris pallida TaxID=29817 RepID=A0AAX6GJ96_IRIPA|nr:pollen-specific leucine-rich repeat extensin-like protein 3 [Iris pallida]